MSQTHRQVRKIELERTTTFDEHLWPIQWTWSFLIVYGAILAARVFSFHEMRPWKNASVWIFALAIGYLIGMSICQRFGQQLGRRRTVLALLLSLIVNLSILVVASRFDLFGPPELLANAVDPPKEPVKFVEYHIESGAGEDRPRRDFEEPVEAGSPAARQDVPLTRHATRADTSPFEPSRESSADVEILVARPLPTMLRQFIETVPHFADLQGTISRQSIQVRPRDSKPSLADNRQPRQTEQLQLRAAPSDVQRTTPQSAEAKIDNEFEPALDQPARSPSVARRAELVAPPEIASAEPTLRRQVRSPLTLPNAVVPEAHDGGTSRQTPDVSLSTATTAQLAKREPESPRRSVLDEPVLDELVQVDRTRVARSQPLPESAKFASLPEPSLQRTELRDAPRPDASARMQPAPPAPNSTLETGDFPRPAREEISRTSTESPAQSSQPAESVEHDPDNHPSLSSAKLVRQTDQETPPNEPELETTPLARSMPSSQAHSASPVSAVAEDRSRADSGQSDSRPDPEMSASPTAVAKSIHGISGAREEPNVDHETPSRPSLLTTASASARRDTSTQTEAGPALAPSDAPAVKRARAEAETPSTSMLARQVEGAAAALVNVPREIDASSSSTVEVAGAAADDRLFAARPGESEVDFGATRLATSTGHSRAAGGGQPEINVAADPGNLPRTTSPVQAARPDTLIAVDIREAASRPSSATSADTAAPEEPVSPSESAVIRRSLPNESIAGESPVPASDAAESSAESSGGPTSLTQRTVARRAESAAALESAVVTLGGGDANPTRAPRGRTIDLDHRAQSVGLPKVESSRGAEDAFPVAADNQLEGPIASGVPQRTSDEVTGALDDDRVFAGHSAGPSLSTSHRRTASPANEEGPSIANDSGEGAPVPRSNVARLPSAVQADKITPVPRAGTDARTDFEPAPSGVAVAAEIGPHNRNTSGGLEVVVDADEGVGGLLTDPAERTGLKRRTASSDSSVVIDLPARFVRNQFGGPVAISARAATPAKAFQQRVNRHGKGMAGGQDRPAPRTEQAIEAGLVFLARQQFSDGSWSLNFKGDGRLYDRDERATLRSDTAATGLALLSFLGAGYQHRTEKYQLIVRNGLEFLIDQQKENGDLYVPEDNESNRSAWLYSHAISAIALCEAYGMTQDEWLKEPAQKALDFIVSSQNPDRGGWRYTPTVSSDTSVTGWMMMALRSGELAGLTVPESCFDKINVWLHESQANSAQPHLYRYNPFAPETESQRHGRIPSKSMTSVGLLMRLYSGWDRTRPEMIAGATYLLAHQPAIGSMDNPQRDTYYWYYATQVMFHMGGDYWRAWNSRLHPLLVESQVKSGPMAGSWNPVYPVADRWAIHAGRLYVTTLNLLSLEVYYRHLPIYVDTAK
jgi:hypothetical protein